LLFAADASQAQAGGLCANQPYVVNPDAAQDVIEHPTDFLRCTAGDYALCYYSGADPLPCTVEESGSSADCQCQIFTASQDQPMYVLMTSILNLCAYTETVEACGDDGTGCYNLCNDRPHSPQCSQVELPTAQILAPVCEYIAAGTFDKTADSISTFSFAQVEVPGSESTFALGCNDAAGPYAGCMTASCSGDEADEQGDRYTSCACPVWPSGGGSPDYQFGRRCAEGAVDSSSPGYCTLAEGQVWSAAYNPVGCD
jgi:hypothetical protein